MKFKIFKEAFGVYQDGLVELKTYNDKYARFLVKDVDLYVYSTFKGMKFKCGCEAHMMRMAQDKLCKRIIATIIYIARRKYVVSHPLVRKAYELASGYNINIEHLDDQKVTFIINEKSVSLEIIPTGTRVRTIETEKFQDKYDLEMLATIIYTYYKRGEFKKNGKMQKLRS
jgi:hypothetical protein